MHFFFNLFYKPRRFCFNAFDFLVNDIATKVWRSRGGSRKYKIAIAVFLKYPIASFREFLSPFRLFIKTRLPRGSILRVLHTYTKWNFAIIILNENYNFVRFLNFEERFNKRDHSKPIYNNLKPSLLFKSSASAILCL